MENPPEDELDESGTGPSPRTGPTDGGLDGTQVRESLRGPAQGGVEEDRPQDPFPAPQGEPGTGRTIQRQVHPPVHRRRRRRNKPHSHSRRILSGQLSRRPGQARRRGNTRPIREGQPPGPESGPEPWTGTWTGPKRRQRRRPPPPLKRRNPPARFKPRQPQLPSQQRPKPSRTANRKPPSHRNPPPPGSGSADGAPRSKTPSSTPWESPPASSSKGTSSMEFPGSETAT